MLSLFGCAGAETIPTPIPTTPQSQERAIDATVEARLAQEQAIEATVEATLNEEKVSRSTATTYPTYAPVPTAPPKLVWNFGQ